MTNGCLVTLALLSMFLTTQVCVADDLKVGGKPVKGMLDGDVKYPGGTAGGPWYLTETTVSLEAEQSIDLKAEVSGKERLVYAWLVDPTGVPINISDIRVSAVKKVYKASVEDLHVKGTWKIVVASNLSGPFTLTVTDASIDKDSVEFLEKRKKELEAELKEVIGKLEAARKR